MLRIRQGNVAFKQENGRGGGGGGGGSVNKIVCISLFGSSV